MLPDNGWFNNNHRLAKICRALSNLDLWPLGVQSSTQPPSLMHATLLLNSSPDFAIRPSKDVTIECAMASV